ncbi:acidic repeat-containing protein [Caerostris extrusa]|uniref:Acidic repeat-containing protein n=1 Tax=Caerostris extrusa TaxID=172846 RepID=A0AAV4M902_CAEEX|nr:acidic repeat-containing protein [Caerostris extrusa]
MKKGLPIEFGKVNSSLLKKSANSEIKQRPNIAGTKDDMEELYHIQEATTSLSDVSINLTDMENEAQKDFKRNLTWSDHLRTTAGYTHCSRNKITNVYSCKIELAVKVLTSFDRLRDTLLHEMCHAAVWVVNKHRCNHGPLWQTWAHRCNLILPNVEIPTKCHNYQISYKFMYKCLNCKWNTGRHSRCSKLLHSKCPKCGGSINLIKS